MASGEGLIALGEGLKAGLQGYMDQTEKNERKRELQARLEADKADRLMRNAELQARLEGQGFLAQKDVGSGLITSVEKPEGFLTEQQKDLIKAGYDPKTGLLSAEKQQEKDLARRKAEAEILKLQSDSAKEKAPTEGQFKAAGFGLRAEQAEKDLLSSIGKGGMPSLSERAKGLIPFVGEKYKKESTKLREQAERNFINSILRKESGASISDKEFENAQMQYFPQPGDSQAVLDQKKVNRQQAINTLKAEGLPALPKIKVSQDEASKMANQYGLSYEQAAELIRIRKAARTNGAK